MLCDNKDNGDREREKKNGKRDKIEYVLVLSVSICTHVRMATNKIPTSSFSTWLEANEAHKINIEKHWTYEFKKNHTHTHTTIQDEIIGLMNKEVNTLIDWDERQREGIALNTFQTTTHNPHDMAKCHVWIVYTNMLKKPYNSHMICNWKPKTIPSGCKHEIHLISTPQRHIKYYCERKQRQATTTIKNAFALSYISCECC